MNKPRKITDDEIQFRKNDLERKFNYAYKQMDEKSFFIGVSDYTNAIEKSGLLRYLVHISLIDNQFKITKPIDDLSIKTVEETMDTFNQLIKIMKDNRIDEADFQYEIDQYRGYSENKIQMLSGFGNQATSTAETVASLCWSLHQKGYTDLVKKFAEYSRDKTMIVDFSVSESNKTLSKMIKRLEEYQIFALWSDWNKLTLVYVSIYLSDDFSVSYREKNEQANLHNFIGLVQEMKEILGIKKLAPWLSQYRFFKMEEFKRYLDRIHNHILSEIDRFSLTKRIEKKSDSLIKTIVIPKENPDFCYFDGRTFKLQTSDGGIKAINFSPTKTKGSDTYYLFSALVNILKQKGERKDNIWFFADITMEEITKRVAEEFNENKDRDWVKNTKSNLKKVIPDALLSNYIQISNYQSKGYSFGLKLPK